MEEEKRINYPYYETAYLDDNNTKHLVNLRSKDEVNFYNDRFTVISTEYRS